MPAQQANVFVSYSHADAALVSPVVKLLRVNRSLVFQDIDDIQPGKKWRSEISGALAGSHLVVVFWCQHAQRSEEVSREWQAAIAQDKDILPLLLDGTPLPPQLGEYQWIDFRGTVGDSHADIGITAPPRSPSPATAAPRSMTPWLSFAGVGVVVMMTVGLLTTLNAPDMTELPGHAAPQPAPAEVPPVAVQPGPPPVVELPVPALPPAPHDYLLDGVMPLLLGAIVVLTLFIAWWLRRRMKFRRRAEVVQPGGGAIEHHIATQVEAEILRRTLIKRDDEA